MFLLVEDCSCFLYTLNISTHLPLIFILIFLSCSFVMMHLVSVWTLTRETKFKRIAALLENIPCESTHTSCFGERTFDVHWKVIYLLSDFPFFCFLSVFSFHQTFVLRVVSIYRYQDATVWVMISFFNQNRTFSQIMFTFVVIFGCRSYQL